MVLANVATSKKEPEMKNGCIFLTLIFSRSYGLEKKGGHTQITAHSESDSSKTILLGLLVNVN